MPGGIHPPLEVMLSWPTPNYANPVTRPKTILILACVLGPLTICLLLARLWVRIRMQSNAGLDDWLMVAALPFIIALTVIIPMSSDIYKFNTHVWDIDPRYFIIQRKYVLAIEVLFCIASGLIKISILLFYRRLSARAVSNTFRWVTWLSIGFIGGSSVAFTLVPIVGCKPMSAFWEQLDVVKVLSGYQYHCFNEGVDVFLAGVVSATQDLLAALLPTFLYWNLRIPILQKLALFGIFAIGYCAVAFGALRAYYSWRIFYQTYDVTWETWNAWKMTLIELHVGAMCANAPALKVFCKEYLRLDKLTSRSKSSSGGSRSKGYSNGPSVSSRTGTILVSLCFGTSENQRQKHGYLSEPHTDISVDQHGGVRIQKDAHLSDPHVSTHDSVDVMNGRYDDDIEMGSFVTHPSTGDPNIDSKPSSRDGILDMQALPPFSPQAYPVNAILRSPPPSARHSLAPFPFRSKGRPPAWQSWS
ncbi:hypothetical protein K458DRAFT_377526 [Lentithecium fluviatile CBS 122367]|uniref:Rhodopsin domain-containing protein n=1 Tax=Lentithecium fluviatile CBS 122367 TaxID=1168545 RepID=A0A6G1IJ08_9PLEO|nr:hypothetical protein K458DRAFT_377526 [Lentithecium fluviatile CBS 122367]